jgi:hypothetical protein
MSIKAGNQLREVIRFRNRVIIEKGDDVSVCSLDSVIALAGESSITLCNPKVSQTLIGGIVLNASYHIFSFIVS